MADYDIFREQLAIKYPAYGHALWEPSPWQPDRPVEVGDVGFIRNGKFHCLFNALRSAEEQSNVPEYHEQLVPRVSDHISKGSLSSNHYCSAGIIVEPEPDFHAFSPDDIRQVSFRCPRRRGGAVLSLPVKARREDTLAKGDFGAWMVKNIDRWFSFARELGLGIDQMEEIILVTGCDRTRSWTNLAFFENEHNARATFGSKVVHSPAISIEWQSSPENIQGVVLHRGPDGTNLPEDQCVFIRGFRVARTFRILPKHLKAAAGPSSDPDGYDCEPDLEVVSIPATSKYRDPLQILLDYIAERAPDCDMFLIHDDDLKRIDGIGNGTSPEALQPDVMMDLLRRPNIEIHTVPCDSPHINSNSSSNTEVVRVAMFLTQEWSIAPQSQLSSLAAQSTGLHHASESSVLPTKTGHANEALSTLKNLGRSHPIHRPEHAIQRPSLHSAFPSPPHTTSKRVVKLIVISDFACPWCFIAHRELQDAIAQCSNLPISFVVEYRPFLLHTTAPTEPIDKNEFVGRKIGRERWEAYKLMATERGEAVGINFSFAGPVSLTTPAHRLMTKAYEIGGPAAQSSLITPIFRASYEDDLDISDPDVLADLAEQAPIMSRAEALSFIKSEECLATVNHQVSEARAKGVTGVPFTIIDRKWAISGGQSAPVFVAIFSKLAEAAGSPSSQLSTSPTGLLQQVPCFT